jgi:hypothetical protein
VHEFGFILYARIHHLLDQSENLCLVPWSVIKFFTRVFQYAITNTYTTLAILSLQWKSNVIIRLTDYFNRPYYLHGLSLQEAADFILSKEILIYDQRA